jgi:general nucleoside transport system permease protein
MAFDLQFFTSLVGTTMFLAAPIAFAFLGVMWAELSGVFVFGIEGEMLIGASAGFLGTLITGNLLIGLLVGLAAGVCLGLLSGFFEVTLGADQIIFAIALLVIGPSLSSYLYGSYLGTKGLGAFALSINTFPNVPIPYLSSIPLLGPVFDQPLLVYLVYVLMIVTHIFFYHTSLGLKFRSVGMNPLAADSMGTNVYLVRYASLIISSMLAALGGMLMIMAGTGFWVDNVTAGRGLIAIALVRVGNWKTQLTFLSSLVVAGLLASAADLQTYFSGGGSVTTTVPYEFFSTLPYIFAIAIIGVAYKWTRSNQPASIGRPYKRE